MPRPLAQSQVIIFLGPPGSGKGTQAARLSSTLGIPAISTGEMLRREAKSGTRLGMAIKKVMTSGQLVSDDLINQVLASRLKNSDCANGCILDGYPRTISQARFLNDLLVGLRKPQPVVFNFEIESATIVTRISRRRQCAECGRIFSISGEKTEETLRCDYDGSLVSQRADDRPEVVHERLRQYERNAIELVRHYATEDYHSLSADSSPEQITDHLLSTLAATWSPQILSRGASAAHQVSLHG